MDKEKYINQLSPVLFWDVDKSQLDMDTYPSFFVQRVLEYGQWSDWNIILKYYGLEKIKNNFNNSSYNNKPDTINNSFGILF